MTNVVDSNDDTTNILVTTRCREASDFVKYYTDYMSKARHKLRLLYMPNAELVWDGNSIKDCENIQKFFEQLPQMQFFITCYDCQPISNKVVGEQTTMIVTSCGYISVNNCRKNFYQSSLISEQNNKWKIVAD